MAEDWKKIALETPWAVNKTSYPVAGPWEVKNSSWVFSPEVWEIIPVYKPEHSEGDEITSYLNAVWNTVLTGVPIDTKHDPCGYWWKKDEYILTSCVYPVEEVESARVVGFLIRRAGTDATAPVENSTINTLSVLEGNFYVDFVLVTFTTPIEESTISTLAITEGNFYVDFVLVSFDAGIEEAQIIDYDIISGIFRDGLIEYTHWPVENTEITEYTITEGHHGTT